ncbi:CpaD family pilus assembly lipoprotein [Denitrobaculum tricleocarpae]|uniref:Pilus assembly protein CpaD n=1 Tax=Denitrobaculum tricleocarpae TaxID=2591009 RepID=A0A545TP96_9PROT|nr:CpaD family pilus assembly lipoprotein [Denitrobaculum tricleocarpae]TQV79045.1 hypothetical protein FKG95_15290 [Denitrobaculum tricleocarpae]
MQDPIFNKRVFAPLLMAVSLTVGACSNGQTRFTEEDSSDVVYDNTLGLVERTFNTGSWQQIEAATELQTQSVMQAHAMNFSPGSTTVSETERTRLALFLRTKGIQQGDRIQLDGLRSDDYELLPETVQRIDALRLELANYGLQAYTAERPITVQLAPDNRIAVVITRTLVRLPDCSSVQPNSGARPETVRDCANKSNLGLMVANPADLQQGSPGGFRDGTASVLSIDRYRRGEIIPLDEILSTRGIDQ